MTFQSLTIAILSASLAFAIGCGDSGSPSPSSTPAPSPPATEEGPSEEAAAETEAEVEEVVEEGWGHLKGKFVYDGTAPSPAALQITKDQEYCGQHDLVDESLVVNAENGGLANVVLSLYVRRGKDFPEPHESYAESKAAPAVLDNNKCRFEPHVCFVQAGQTLQIKNSDPMGHNTKIDSRENRAFNQTLPSDVTIEQQYTAAERRPASVGCSIHPWMQGWLVVQETPYVAVTDENGEFEMQNLPSGNWTFQVWQEKAGNVSEVTIDGASKSWSRGRFEMTIQPDTTTDLGEIKVAPDLFED